MITVILSKGKTSVIDECDADRVQALSWYASSCRGRDGHYAVRVHQGKTTYLHRFILNAPNGVTVDHINGDGLDNRRSNLRLATQSENNANRTTKRARSGYRGVYFEKGKYRARAWIMNRGLSLGVFETPEEAALAWDQAASAYFGPFARLNFPARTA